MLDFLFRFWFWLLVCLATGAASGALTHVRPANGRIARWLIWAALAFLVGVVAQTLGVFDGAAAIFLESALGCSLAFLAGAMIGARATGGSLQDHEGWAAGLFPMTMIWLGATFFALGPYQAELRRQITMLATTAGVDASGVVISGHDIGAPAAIAQNAALMSQVATLAGVRRIAALREAEKATPPDIPPPAAEHAAPPAPATKVRSVAASEDANCQRALDALAEDGIDFRRGRAKITRRIAVALDKAATTIRSCAPGTIEIRAAGDATGDRLAQQRAEAVADYLRREGVGDHRLVAAGENAARETKNRAVEFILRPAGA